MAELLDHFVTLELRTTVPRLLRRDTDNDTPLSEVAIFGAVQHTLPVWAKLLSSENSDVRLVDSRAIPSLGLNATGFGVMSRARNRIYRVRWLSTLESPNIPLGEYWRGAANSYRNWSNSYVKDVSDTRWPIISVEEVTASRNRYLDLTVELVEIVTNSADTNL